MSADHGQLAAQAIGARARGDFATERSALDELALLERAPKRIQLRRTKGWRKPEGAVVVARPSRWGNPYVIRGEIVLHDDSGRDWWCSMGGARTFAVESYRRDLVEGVLRVTVDDVRRELAGRDLACWCKPGDPCHAAVLLEIANGGPS